MAVITKDNPAQDFLSYFETIRQNVFPAMLTALSESLGLKEVDHWQQLGIGYDPADDAWVFPERDETGNIIGLTRRKLDGSKLMVKGSKRGFTYAVNPCYFSGRKKYNRGAIVFKPVRKNGGCPICGKPDWCMISEDGVVARCNRIKSDSPIGSGWLHVLDREKYTALSSGSLLYASDGPLLIVEGASDWAAAQEMGFVAIGKPAAKGKEQMLAALVRGKDVIVMGENDSGAGREGMETTFEAVRPFCSATKLMPPNDIKDLRQWYTEFGLTQTQLLDYAYERGSKKSDLSIIQDDSPLGLAREWINQDFSYGDMPTIRMYGGDWFVYQHNEYTHITNEEMRGMLYRFLSQKYVYEQQKNGNTVTKKIEPNRSKITDVVDALHAWCITTEAPTWLKWRESRPAVSRVIAFRNGLLDVDAYIRGDADYFFPPTPEYFTIASIPHVFDPTLQPNAELLDCIYDILKDEDKVKLLQEWAGYFFIPSQEYEKMMLFTGPPRSGKGTIIELLSSMLGQSQVTSTSFGGLCSDFGYAPLVGKLMAVMPDASIPRHVDATAALEKLKQITGGDAVSVNRKYQTHLTSVKLFCRFLIAVNTLPDLPDHAGSLEPRLSILRFTESYIGREDRGLKHKMSARSHTFIPWALEGLKRLKQTGNFTVPKSSQAVYKEAISLMSPTTEFVNACCTVGPKYAIKQSTLYDAWVIWAKEQGLRANSVMKFKQQLMSAVPNLEGKAAIVRGKRTPMIMGIDLTKTVKERFFGV